MRTINTVVWRSKVATKVEQRHGLTCEDVEFVLANPDSESTSRSTGRPCRFGYTPVGDFIIAVYVWLDVDKVEVVTAYPVPEP